MTARVLVCVFALCLPALAQECLECHAKTHPGIVGDWKASAHAQSDVDCIACHGDGHKTAEDVAKVRIPTPAVCAECHEDRVEQYKAGKHALAWAAMKAMPTAQHPASRPSPTPDVVSSTFTTDWMG